MRWIKKLTRKKIIKPITPKFEFVKQNKLSYGRSGQKIKYILSY